MLNQQLITRENKQLSVNWGYTPDYKSRLYIDHVETHPVFNLPVQDRPKRMVMDFGENGELVNIQTTWKRSLMAGGKEITGTGNDFYMTTNAADRAGFVVGLSGPILRSMINGNIRAILGHNGLPLFANDGTILVYTAAQEAQAPTNDYHPAP